MRGMGYCFMRLGIGHGTRSARPRLEPPRNWLCRAAGGAPWGGARRRRFAGGSFYSASMPPSVPVLHEFPHLRLLLRVEAVVKIAQRRDHFGALCVDSGRLLADERLGASPVELV